MLSLMFGGARASFLTEDRWWSTSWVPKTKAGVEVDETTALVHSAVFRCSRLLTETPAGLPIRCYRHSGDDRVAVGVDEVPALSLLQFAPNDEMTAGVFREGRMLHQVNYGNGFAEIVRDGRGQVVALHPIHACRVSPAERDSGYAYAIRNNTGKPTGMRREEMLHICGTLSSDGIWGSGVVSFARENFGTAIATERHGGQFFGSGAQPRGVVTAKDLMGDSKKAQRDQFRREWKEMHGSPDSSEIAILPGDSTYTPITLTNQDNQFLESQVRNQDVICNWYGVPLYMLGSKVQAGNIEHLSNEFIIYGLFPWSGKFEQQCNFKLLDRRQQGSYFFEHDFSALLRGDIQTRMNAYRVAIMTGVFTINHCRRMENLPGIGPAGDVIYLPANLVTAEYMQQHGSGSAQTPGSDHTGAPADNPGDHEPKAFAEWKGGLTKIKGADLTREVAALEQQLEDRPAEWREAARLALTDVLRRMFTKESQAALTAIDKRGDFPAWVREFYSKHQGVMAAAIEPACAALRLAGVKEWDHPANLAAWLKSRSVEEMTKMHTHDSKEARLRRLAAWPTDRVSSVVEEILRGDRP